METECMKQGLPVAWQELDGSSFPSIVIVAFLLAVLIAPFLLNRYQRKVEQLMRDNGPSAHGDECDEPIEESVSRTQLSATSGASARVSVADLAHASIEQFQNVSKRLIAAAAAFGTIATLTLVLAAVSYAPSEHSAAYKWLGNIAYYLLIMPAVLMPLIAIETPVRRQRVWLVIPIISLVFFVSLGFVVETPDPTGEDVFDTVLGLVAFGLIFLAIIGRRLRNVVPLMTLWLSALLFPWIPAGFFMTVIDTCESTELVALGFFGSIGLLWLLIRQCLRLTSKVSAAYEQQKFSDAQFRVALWALVLSFTLMFEATADGDEAELSLWAFGIVLAFVMGGVVYVRRLRDLEPWPHPQAMLMLRVFSSEKGVQNLLDDVSARWSFVGPIYLVGGPDLAKAYLEPHELLLFLQRRLKSLFVLSRNDLDERLQHLELRADPDTRYRVNEFFCHDDTWKPTVIALLDRVQVILLDLRGFVNEDSGTAYELDLLARTGMLRRTVFLQDEFTSEKIVAKIVDEHYDGTIGEKQIVRVDRNTTVDAVVQRLSHTALL